MTAEAQRANFRAFLDGVQYSRTGILRYERIFGPGFVSTGGLETTKVSVALPRPACPALPSPSCLSSYMKRCMMAGSTANSDSLHVQCVEAQTI